MKRFFALLIAALVAGFFLAACGNLVPPVPTVAPASTVVPAPTAGQPNGGRFAHGEG